MEGALPARCACCSLRWRWLPSVMPHPLPNRPLLRLLCALCWLEVSGAWSRLMSRLALSQVPWSDATLLPVMAMSLPASM
ncbi:hypothetical protein D3C71_1714720 [compost metagenome]